MNHFLLAIILAFIIGVAFALHLFGWGIGIETQIIIGRMDDWMIGCLEGIGSANSFRPFFQEFVSSEAAIGMGGRGTAVGQINTIRGHSVAV